MRDDESRPRHAYRQHRARRVAGGSATGAIVRPPRRRPPPAPKPPPRRHLRAVAKRPDPRQRARRAIKTTKPLFANRFGAGRPRPRLVSTLVVLVLVLTAVLAKVVLLQGTRGEALRGAAAQQWTRNRDISAQRGAIFDRNGDELALSVPAATVAVNPKQVLDAAGTIAILGDLLGLSEERRTELVAELEARDSGFEYIDRQVDPQIGQEIQSLELVGVTVYDEDRRMMPGGTVGQSVIGRTDIDGVGIAGLELQYEALLQGIPGETSLEVAPGGRSIAGSEQVVQPAISGTDIVTTVDRSVQYQSEQVLRQHVGRTGAQGGQVVVMDTDTGDVLAMVSVERNEQGVPVVSSGNYAAVGAYEPGSVGKVITLAGALEDGAVTTDEYFYVEDRYDCTLDPTNGVLYDSHYHDPQSLTAAGILVESSNVGTIKIGQRLGYERLDHYLRAFGLGESTALDFPGESAGILKPWSDWTGTERCTVSYGQGLASTPIQLAAAVNVIANDGVYVAPRLVTATVQPDGTLVEAPASETRPVVSQATAEQTQSIMREVVCAENGTAIAARVDGLSVAGKTGTAYIAQEDGTYFTEDGIHHEYYSSFVGFFPAEDPQVTILISIDRPQQGFNSGAQSAAPAFRELAPTIIHELGVVSPPGSTDCDGD